jgi:hypothetical protein
MSRKTNRRARAVLGFCSKTEARMAAARMKLLRNRRDAQLRKMRGDVAALLRDGRDDTARIRVRPPPRVSSPSSPQMPHRLLPASPHMCMYI